MFKKVLASFVLGCVMVSGSALAQVSDELVAKSEQIGQERTMKCAMLARSTVNCYKYGNQRDKYGVRTYMDGIEKFMMSYDDQKKEGIETPVVWSVNEIEKWEDICITAYNAGVDDYINHGWNPRFFNMAISNYGPETTEACVMNDYFSE